MANESLFHWAGEQLGQLIRTVVDGLAWVLTHLSEAVGGFYTGLRDTLGIGDSTASLVMRVWHDLNKSRSHSRAAAVLAPVVSEMLEN